MTKNASPCNRLLWQTRKTDSMWRQKVIKSVNKYNHIKDFAFASHGHPHIFRSHSNDQNQFNICLLLVMERWKGSKPTANSCNTVLWLWDIYPLKTHHFPWLVIHHLPPKLLLLQHILKILHEFYHWPLQLFKLFLKLACASQYFRLTTVPQWDFYIRPVRHTTISHVKQYRETFQHRLTLCQKIRVYWAPNADEGYACQIEAT